ncbi:hypothetical protein ATCC90586_005518 [Pythium insidiosum]|nr:hypothetical protein ATCC90586_005518 [Pythium insidiosum]
MPTRPWVATRLELHAIAGLAATHTAPFVRVRYNDPTKRRRPSSDSECDEEDDASRRCRVVCIELPEDATPPESRHPEPSARRQPRRFTARWASSPSVVAFVPIAVPWLEVQLWTQLRRGMAVFLGAAQIDLAGLQRRQRGHTDAERLDNKSIGVAPQWFALHTSETMAMTGRLELSVALSISFVDGDPKRPRDPNAVHTAVDPMQTVVDPGFVFVWPTERIEWSTVVAANVQRIFVQGDVAALRPFRRDVLLGDMQRELREDAAIHVHDDVLQAFRLAQLSAQYLAHCVDMLQQRVDGYEDQATWLRARRRELRDRRRDRVDAKRRLEKQSKELDILLTTYRSMLRHHGVDAADEPETTQQQDKVETEALEWPRTHQSDGDSKRKAATTAESPTASGRSLTASKPAFLMTWEEREQARRQQKELDKPQRIEAEKMRLQQLQRDRQRREDMDAGLARLAARRRERAVRTLQHALRSFLQRRIILAAQQRRQAAVTLQRRIRAFLARHHWKTHVREELRQLREQRTMARCEDEAKQIAHAERQLMAQQQQQQQRVGGVDAQALSRDAEDEGHSAPAASALAAMWRKLRRVFVAAWERGTRVHELFRRLDERGDGVIDRAELRTGLRRFGVRIDRTMTRALIVLLRARNEAASRPLTLTLEQFVQGFNLSTALAMDSATSTTANTDTDTDNVATKAKDATSTRGRHSRASSSSSDSDSTSVRRSSSSSASTRDDVDARMIERVATAVAQLRERVLEAATDHLRATGRSATDYFAFRDALRHVFDEFDVDQNGELDLSELVQCMAAIQFQVTPENLAMLRECFVVDANSETVSIDEFISFALAGLEASADVSSPREELGILGFQLRDALLRRVKAAHRHTESIEDAVRAVFKGSFPSKKRQASCPRATFVRVLASLKLGFTPAQLSRLVLRLDRDKDATISFDELLTWLRLQDASSNSPTRPVDDTELTTRRSSMLRRTSSFQLTSLRTKLLRDVLLEIAGVAVAEGTGAESPERHHVERAATTLFHRIDSNRSNKINTDELEAFFGASVTLSSLETVAKWDDLARHVMRALDKNANGVLTLAEWVAFFVGDTERLVNAAERLAIVENVRQTLRGGDSSGDPLSTLTAWFRSIPGTIAVDRSRADGERRVRVREWKSAVRSKYPFIALRELDEAAKALDADGSMWITEREFREWLFPTRDVEELCAIVGKRWQAEWLKQPEPRSPLDAFAATLYRCFDLDDNGALARQELRDGLLRRFQIALNDQEMIALMQHFDQDGDGCLSRLEFQQRAMELVAHVARRPSSAVSVTSSHNASITPLDLADRQPSEDGDDTDVYLSSPNSSERMSNDGEDVDDGALEKQQQGHLRAVEYSEDFDE